MDGNRLRTMAGACWLAAVLAVTGCAPIAGMPQAEPGSADRTRAADPNGVAVTRVPVDGAGRLMSITAVPGGAGLYVLGSDGIAVIDVRRRAVVATIPVPGASGSVAVAPDGARAFVSAGSSIGMIDTAANAVVAAFDAPVSGAEDLVISPDGARLYTLGTRTDVLSVLDAGNGSVVATLPLGRDLDPGRLAVTPDGRAVRVTTRRGIAEVDTATGALTGAVHLGGSAVDLAIGPDGTRTYVAVGSDRVAVVENGAPAGEIRVPSGPIAVSADGGLLFVGGSHGATAWAIDTATVAATVDLGHPSEDVAFAPDADVAYALDAGGAVSVVDLTALR